MPTKFVSNSAERAGVSIETAEHRWAEAKKAVHKGKRRGSWYWGKVVNTFKRMMGLSEAITLKEWMLFEEEQMFAHWPKAIRLYGPYVAVKSQEEDGFVMYHVEAIMGDKLNAQLSASKIRGGPHEGGAAFTAGIDGDFTQGLGITVPPPNGNRIAGFKQWAINAMKSMAVKLQLPESDQGQNKNDTAERAMIHKIVALAHNAGLMKGGVKTEANLEQAYDFLESDWGGKLWDKHYELFSTMDPKYEGPFDRQRYGTFKREAVAWFKKWKNGATFKDEPLPKLHEETEGWPKHLKLDGPFVARKVEEDEFSTIYEITKIMADRQFGIRAGVRRGRDGAGLWFIRPNDMSVPASGEITRSHTATDVEVHDVKGFSEWLTGHIKRLRKDHVLEDALSSDPEEYKRVVLYPASGRWPAVHGRDHLTAVIHALNAIVQPNDWYHRYSLDTKEMDHQLEHGGELEIWYRKGSKLVPDELKKHGVKIDFMSDYEPKVKIDDEDIYRHVAEAKGLSIPQGMKTLPEKIMLRNGYYLEKLDVRPTKAIYQVKRLLDDSVYGRLYMVRRGGADGKYMWQLQKPGSPGSGTIDGGPVATQVIDVSLHPHLQASDVAFDKNGIRDFVVANLPLLPLVNS